VSAIVEFRPKEIEDYLGRRLHRSRTGAVGSVALVGAGPGDPELLTLKAVRLLQSADAVVYDSLVNVAVLAHVDAAAERIFVGKRKDRHTLPQARINDLLVALALEGKRVVRLKGGDPFVFGRGGEEVDALEARGVPWEVVPGITAATGCAAATGVPLTHRDVAHAVTFITAHRRNGALEFDWALALHPQQTVVFYMGLAVIGEIAAGLIARGRPADTPVAVIANGTSADQRMLRSTLAGVGAEAAAADLPSPALIIVGEVAAPRVVRAAANGLLDRTADLVG
jgi:uroporphyrin-III C-methyltransferase/precorrin-2 dehydrogenase/sirohydrochlorin ferrochelatase